MRTSGRRREEAPADGIRATSGARSGEVLASARATSVPVRSPASVVGPLAVPVPATACAEGGASARSRTDCSASQAVGSTTITSRAIEAMTAARTRSATARRSWASARIGQRLGRPCFVWVSG